MLLLALACTQQAAPCRTGMEEKNGECVVAGSDTDGKANAGADTDFDAGADTDSGLDTGTDTGVEPADYASAFGHTMLLLPAGTFTMGGGTADPDDQYRDHEVTLTHAFWLGNSEVTQAEWAAWTSGAGNTDETPSYHAACAECPVEQMGSMTLYANALSNAEGLPTCYNVQGRPLDADPYACRGYRLPTEAEWEYAARAGQDTAYSGSDVLAEVGWSSTNGGGETHPRCGLAKNAWGLCDMTGNVSEFTSDIYAVDYGGYGDGRAQTDPTGAVGNGNGTVIRGGAWPQHERDCLLAARNAGDGGSYIVGFRVARTVIDE